MELIDEVMPAIDFPDVLQHMHGDALLISLTLGAQARMFQFQRHGLT